jgi:ABC-type multidrug transport system ATPase subunit
MAHRDAESGTAKPAATGKPLIKALSRAFLSVGLPVAFSDVTYTVVSSADKTTRLALLDSVSGHLKPGELTALMGPSGCGKTTLLDVLAGRKTVGEISGEVRFGGEPASREFLRRYTGYCEQSDTLIPELTVEEMLLYTADLKRPRAQPAAEKRAAVEELLGVLALAGCRAVRIGSAAARGVSGGQAKRVNIGIALIANPRVLFLDEPTSGLDSFTANEVMSTVRSLAAGGITVCATIHSPTAYAFGLFDRLLLLLGGRVAYFGAAGQPALSHFRGVPGAAAAPGLAVGESEAEWVVDLTTRADREGRAGDYTRAYAASPLAIEMTAETAGLLAAGGADLSAHSRKALAARRETVTPGWWQLRTLLKYRSPKHFASPDWLGPRIGDKVRFCCCWERLSSHYFFFSFLFILTFLLIHFTATLTLPPPSTPASSSSRSSSSRSTGRSAPRSRPTTSSTSPPCSSCGRRSRRSAPPRTCRPSCWSAPSSCASARTASTRSAATWRPRWPRSWGSRSARARSSRASSGFRSL